MTNEEIFNKLFGGGVFTLPYLIKFSDGENTVCLINDNQDLTYKTDVYKKSTFDYTPPDNTGEGGSLTVTAIDNNLFEFIENSTKYTLDVVGVLSEDGEVQRLRQYQHFFGSVSCSENMELEFTLGQDDRLDMMFCPYKFDTDNNRANA